MKYTVKNSINSSHSSLCSSARSVVEVAHEINCFRPWREHRMGGRCVVGPSGIPYGIDVHDFNIDDGGPLDVHIYETPGSVSLYVPIQYFETEKPSISNTPWLFDALISNNDETIRDLLTQLAFGELPLAVAEKLLKVPSKLIESNMRSRDLGPSGVLRSSITHLGIRPNLTIVDVRGMLAWLLVNSRESFDDLV